jgi:hypothetical protein
MCGCDVFGFCRSPLKIFIVVCFLCIFSTIIAGSGLYRGVSEDKYSSLKNIYNYDGIYTDHAGMDEEETLYLQQKAESGGSGGGEAAADSSSPSPSPSSPSWLRELFPNAETLFLCAVGFLASYGEGGMVTWSVIYYERYLGVSDALNSLGYITFMVCMACGRFVCDTLR